MNATQSTAKFVLGIFLLVLVLGLTSAITIAEWNFDSQDLDPNVDVTSSAELEISDSRTDNYVDGNPADTGKALSVGNWSIENRFIELTLDTSDYKDIILKLDEKKGSTLTASNFSVQYHNGAGFVNFSTNVPIASSFGSTPMHTFNLSSISYLEDNSEIKLRLVIPETSAGNWHLDNIKIEATEIGSDVTTEDPEEIQECADIGNLGANLVTEIRDMGVSNGFGKDDEWYVFDEIEVEVRVKNSGSDYIENIVVHWGVYNTELESWLIDEEENDFDLDSKESETITISFKVDDLSEIEDAVDADALSKYVLYVWTTGEDEEFDFDDTCSFKSENVDIKTERDFVVLKDITHEENVKCGSIVDVSATVWNIGSRDQEDVSIEVYNQELGINQEIPVGDIDAFEDSLFSFNYNLPSNLTEKSYQIRYSVLDRRGDAFENSEDDPAVFYTSIKVDSCGPAPEEVLVTAALESEAKAGRKLAIKATITNNGDNLRGYSLNLKDYSTWAEMLSVEPTTFVVSAGETKEVLITLQVNREAEGEKTFDIEVYSEGTFLKAQPVSVLINPTFNFDLGRFFSGLANKNNWYIWGIAALNLALVVTIIIVAIKVMKK
ncbi:MAG TPA: putative S-layer protein [Candidatus Pacearchaeota archaeon]|nr:putative S-layer protein [Candidatus Pacearchaeota archaeon]